LTIGYNGGIVVDLDNAFVILDDIIKNPDRKKAYFDLVHEYMFQDQSFRDIVTQLWDFNVPWIFQNGCRLASTIGEVESPETKIRAGLLFYSIGENDLRDIRDDTIGVAICYHSCLAANIDPEVMFRSVIDISTPKARKLLSDFLQRPDDRKSMKVFGLIKTVANDGIIEIKVSDW
jgi:hypothetical protein